MDNLIAGLECNGDNDSGLGVYLPKVKWSFYQTKLPKYIIEVDTVYLELERQNQNWDELFVLVILLKLP